MSPRSQGGAGGSGEVVCRAPIENTVNLTPQAPISITRTDFDFVYPNLSVSFQITNTGKAELGARRIGPISTRKRVFSTRIPRETPGFFVPSTPTRGFLSPAPPLRNGSNGGRRPIREEKGRRRQLRL